MIYLYIYLGIAIAVSIYFKKFMDDNPEQLYNLINMSFSDEEKKLLEDNPNTLNYLPLIAGLIWPVVLIEYITFNNKE